MARCSPLLADALRDTLRDCVDAPAPQCYSDYDHKFACLTKRSSHGLSAHDAYSEFLLVRLRSTRGPAAAARYAIEEEMYPRALRILQDSGSAQDVARAFFLIADRDPKSDLWDRVVVPLCVSRHDDAYLAVLVLVRIRRWRDAIKMAAAACALNTRGHNTSPTPSSSRVATLLELTLWQQAVSFTHSGTRRYGTTRPLTH